MKYCKHDYPECTACPYCECERLTAEIGRVTKERDKALAKLQELTDYCERLVRGRDASLADFCQWLIKDRDAALAKWAKISRAGRRVGSPPRQPGLDCAKASSQGGATLESNKTTTTTTEDNDTSKKRLRFR